MKKLHIDNFKAYPKSDTEESYFLLDLEKNVLLYGENGAGKSSIYQAIKLFFFEDRLTAHLNDTALPEPEVEERKRTFLDQYRHRNSTPDSGFTINILDDNGQAINRGEYEVFMLDEQQIKSKGERGKDWRLQEMIKGALLNIQDVPSFCESQKEVIEATVNQKLQDFLEQNLEYTLDATKNHCIGLSNSNSNISRQQQDIPNYFNEAKINLVLLLTYFTTIAKYTENLGSGKKKVLVLDDFITSLDSANRLFIIQYLLATFQDFRIIVLTHNINFYNLFKHVVGDKRRGQEWFFYNLCVRENSIFTYKRGSTKTAKEIKIKYNNNRSNTGEVANMIRKRFEVLVHQFAKILLLDHIEDNKKLLQRIIGRSTVYMKDKDNHANQLVDKLCEILEEADESSLRSDLIDEINEYKWQEHQLLKEVLGELELYKRLVMNPMSHGATNERASHSSKFIEKSLFLLEKLERQLKDLIDKSVIGEV